MVSFLPPVPNVGRVTIKHDTPVALEAPTEPFASSLVGRRDVVEGPRPGVGDVVVAGIAGIPSANGGRPLVPPTLRF